MAAARHEHGTTLPLHEPIDVLRWARSSAFDTCVRRYSSRGTLARAANVVHMIATGVASLMFIAAFGIQSVRVVGFSMEPTLDDHDELIVDRLVYEFGEPSRGDIVTLYDPRNPSRTFVKRVIATEGDVVEIVDGRVYVNDVLLRDDYVVSKYRDHESWGPQIIQRGYDFVMGDHRTVSSDSREWGPVPKRYIFGKVMLRWWPLLDLRTF